MSDWQKNMDTMYADTEFMLWLDKDFPDHYCEYSGNLLARYDAFNAGKKLTGDRLLKKVKAQVDAVKK
jgi:hypothetical protein